MRGSSTLFDIGGYLKVASYYMLGEQRHYSTPGVAREIPYFLTMPYFQFRYIAMAAI